MNNLEYLNHISQSNRPVKPVKKQSSLPIGKIIKLLLGGFVVTMVLIAVGVLINTGDKRAVDLTRQLYSRVNSVNSTINQYNKLLKSSQLRSIGYSLSGTLTGTSSQLSAYLTSQNSNSKESAFALSSQAAAEEAAMFESANSVNAQLNNAKLNGLLDRNYASQLHLQISLMMSMISEILERDHAPNLQQILDSFYSNLDVILQSLDNYSSRGV